MNQRGLIIGSVVAVTAVGIAYLLRRSSRKKKKKEVKSEVVKQEQYVQDPLPFMDEKELMMISEFEKFRDHLDTVSRMDFDRNYGELRDILAVGGRPEESQQVGLIFIASVVLRNRMNKLAFTETTRSLLEGNSEILPSAIEEAARNLDDDQIDRAKIVGKIAMDCVTSGLARNHFLSASVH